MGALNAFFDRIYTRSKCQKLLKYQSRQFEFSDLGIEIPPVKISFGGFRTEVKTIEQAGESAKALDDFQYQLCRDLENKTLKEQLDKGTWTKYIKARFAANALILGFRSTLEAFKSDPTGQRKSLDSIIEDIQRFVKCLSGDLDKNYDSPAGIDAVSTAISHANTPGLAISVDEHKIDELLAGKFREFKNIQSNILEKITEVEEIFKESRDRLKLLEYDIKIFTAESKFKPGNIDCWKDGEFTDRDIKSGYDARRPVTDEIIDSVEKNPGTIIYGDPYAGKSILLKRITFELIQKDYVVLYGDNIEAKAYLLQELLTSIAESYEKIVFIVDNVHKSASESVFQVFNNIEAGKVRFLFSAREKQLDENRRRETQVALSDIPTEAQFRIEFDIDYAILLFTKAIEVTSQIDPKPEEIEYATRLYDYSKGDQSKRDQSKRDQSKGDPLMYNLGLRLYLSKGSKIGSKTMASLMQVEMGKIIKDIEELKEKKNLDLWSATIFSCLTGIADVVLNLSEKKPTSLLDCFEYTLDDLRYLGREGILLKEIGPDVLKIRHERLAYEFLSCLYKQKSYNNPQNFDRNYRVMGVMNCIWNAVNSDAIIDILSTCSYLQEVEEYEPISKLITSLYVVPADQYVLPSRFSDDEKARLLSYGLGNFYFRKEDYAECLAYYQKSLDLNSKDATVFANKGAALINLHEDKEAIALFDKALKIDARNVVALGNKGAALMNLRKNDEAITWYDKALDIRPNDAFVLANKGTALINLHKDKKAIALFDKALKIDERNVVALRGKGSALINQAKYEEAITWYDKALDIDSNDAAVLSNKGTAISKMGRNEEAIKLYDKALEIDARNVIALCNKGLAIASMGRYDEAITWYDKALEIKPNEATVLADKGSALHSLGKDDVAITLYDKALNIDARNVKALCNKGLAIASMGRYDEAITWYDKALEIKPNEATVLAYKGIALNNLGKKEQAIILYDKALKIDAWNVVVLNSKALTLTRLGKDEEAITWFDKALKINANDEDALTGKGSALHNIGKDEEAITLLDKALKINANNVDALTDKGSALHNIGKDEEAITLLDKALKINANNVDALTDKGSALHNIGKDEEAITLLDKALKINAKDVHTLMTKGLVLLNLGKYEETIACYDKILKIDANDVPTLLSKGLVLSHLNRYSEATKCYDKALKIDSSDPDTWFDRARSNSKLGKVDNALRDLKTAIEIGGEEYKTKARNEEDFDNMQGYKRFEDVVR
jgi:tetratricopeptide (TPR) repeat protein